MTYVLKIQVDNCLLNQVYKEEIITHNEKIKNDPHPDSGFDLYISRRIELNSGSTLLCDLEVKCAVYKNGKPVGYYLYPRSSISKTEFRLSNNVGIIDSGYRGNLKVSIDCLDRKYNCKSYVITPGSRLFQICMGDLTPFTVELVEKLDSTIRGTGGHGSTGK